MSEKIPAEFDRSKSEICIEQAEECKTRKKAPPPKKKKEKKRKKK